jgi:hypothetical protein
MKPFVIGMHIMLVLVALVNIIMIGDEYSIGFYIACIVGITIVGHLGLKLWEIVFVQLLNSKVRKRRILSNCIKHDILTAKISNRRDGRISVSPSIAFFCFCSNKTHCRMIKLPPVTLKQH